MEPIIGLLITCSVAYVSMGGWEIWFEDRSENFMRATFVIKTGKEFWIFSIVIAFGCANSSAFHHFPSPIATRRTKLSFIPTHAFSGHASFSPYRNRIKSFVSRSLSFSQRFLRPHFCNRIRSCTKGNRFNSRLRMRQMDALKMFGISRFSFHFCFPHWL